MKKQLSCILLSLTVFSINALPVQAANKKAKSSKEKKQLVLAPGQWCFELAWMGLFCYEL